VSAACTRCNGALRPYREPQGLEYRCLQCGHVEYGDAFVPLAHRGDRDNAVVLAYIEKHGRRPRLLDLFSGAGGAAVGYHRAGFDVVGVDIAPQKNYPFEFHQADAMTYPLEGFDVIHASPPCQGYSRLRHLPWLKDKVYPLLIEPTRLRLAAAGVPYVMENVEDAPLEGLRLCGLMFGLPVYRHRLFETDILALQPAHRKHQVVIGHGRMLNDRAKGSSNKGAAGNQLIVTVAGGQYRKADGERALGIDWMTKPELSESIPPAYTEYVGRQLMAVLL
jgi:DNA (cytosine-5)-methyltransferase 1